MAAGSLLTLFDDIAVILDDVAVMTKIAAKKTAGVLGDDLALNAEQVSGVKADRELPVVWAVAKGSFLNKLILVPAALLISAIAPWLITPLLMLGGAFLCYEGFEKVAHKLFHGDDDDAHHTEMVNALNDDSVDMVDFEKDKVKGAIRTDFILSAEVIVIALGTVKAAPFMTQAIVVSSIALLMTVGVYGLVAGIVRLDDVGLALIKNQARTAWSRIKYGLGRAILWFAPLFMKTLTIVGTAAMFIVGGGILVHGIPGSHELIHHAESIQGQLPHVGHILSAVTPTLINTLFGVVAGGLLFLIISVGGKLMGKKPAH
uniref:Membrane protein, putative n=1 Tax=uncultured Thiotrichaceae bacterium TaxID=298394 RepID=A0A6S6SML9_9GAMM|nr:MAG: Membrane protein, putative [uncultured Thiotrichaceae bacterium]